MQCWLHTVLPCPTIPTPPQLVISSIISISKAVFHEDGEKGVMWVVIAFHKIC